MRQAVYNKAIAEYVAGVDSFSISDIKEACPDVPVTSVYAYVKFLVSSGSVSVTGKGSYSKIPKLSYNPIVTPWMQEVDDIMTDECVGINACISERKGNLVVEVSRVDIPKVLDALRGHYRNVITRKDANRFPAELKGYIIVDIAVSDAPLFEEESGIQMPSVEKSLVDALSRKNPLSSPELKLYYQKSFEQYQINRNRLARYARRRGLAEELESQLGLLDNSRLELFGRLQSYLATIPVRKAWVFGSFARCEETAASDLDLLVTYDKDANVSLLNVGRYSRAIEDLFSRQVDLVEDGCLRDFAAESATRDKYLIYQKR